MRTPSIRTLSAVFSDPVEAKRILTMCHGELSAHPVGAARIHECYHDPAWWDVRLTVLNSIEPGLHGIESCETSAGIEWMSYLNTGDTYTPTLIYWRGNYRVQSVGDFIEHQRVQLK